MTTISIRLKRGSYLKLPLLHFVDGLKKIRYVVLGLHPTFADIINKTFMTLVVGATLMSKKKKLFMLESLRKSKWTTLSDKLIFSDNNVLITSVLQTLRLELTGKERDLKPFWTNKCEDLSKNLWLPTETDSVDSHSNLSNLSYRATMSNSWFSTRTKLNPQSRNLLEISSLLSISTPVETWVKEGIRARKVRIYPSKTQFQTLKQWMGTTRFVYNRALHAVKTDENTKCNFQQLRNRFVTRKRRNGEINPEINDWELNTPKDVRAECLRDLEKGFKVAMINLNSGNINNFVLKYRKKKIFKSLVLSKETISISDGKIKFYPTFLKESFKSSKDLLKIKEIKYDCRLNYSHGKWFIYIPVAVKENINHPNHGICSLDPGINNFQTVFSDKMTVQVTKDKKRLKKLQEKLDLFQSLRSKNMISARSYVRRRNRLYFKHENLIDDMHFKLVKFLIDNFKLILLPSFESQDMVSNKTRNSQFRRNLLELKHYRFKQRLLDKCNLSKYSNVKIVTEEYTSQTCICGKLSPPGPEIFKCRFCSFECHRDILGARNIYIKYFIDNFSKELANFPLQIDIQKYLLISGCDVE